jgi:SCP-2 sterol transfer family
MEDRVVSTYAKLRKIIEFPCEVENIHQDGIDESINSLAINLATATGKDIGRLNINIYDLDQVLHYCLDLTKNECQVIKKQGKDVRFEINVTKETWIKIVMGESAPLDAFLMGQMALFGDIVFGQRLYAKLADKVGKVDI